MTDLQTQIDNYKELEEFVDNIEGNDLAAVVYEQLGSDDLDEFRSTLQDVLRGGANAGWSGFIYHNDTVKFFEENKELIMDSVKETVTDCGYTGVLEFIKSFNCLGEDYTIDEIGAVVYGDDKDDVSIKNALAWYALETVAMAADY